MGRTQCIDNINDKIIMIISGENKIFKRKCGRALNLSASQSKRALLLFRTRYKPFNVLIAIFLNPGLKRSCIKEFL